MVESLKEEEKKIVQRYDKHACYGGVYLSWEPYVTLKNLNTESNLYSSHRKICQKRNLKKITILRKSRGKWKNPFNNMDAVKWFRRSWLVRLVMKPNHNVNWHIFFKPIIEPQKTPFSKIKTYQPQQWIILFIKKKKKFFVVYYIFLQSYNNGKVKKKKVEIKVDNKVGGKCSFSFFLSLWLIK